MSEILKKCQANIKKITGIEINILAVQGASREAEFVHQRALAALYLRESTDMTLAAIGWALGDRNHATIINLLRRYNEPNGAYVWLMAAEKIKAYYADQKRIAFKGLLLQELSHHRAEVDRITNLLSI